MTKKARIVFFSLTLEDNPTAELKKAEDEINALLKQDFEIQSVVGGENGYGFVVMVRGSAPTVTNIINAAQDALSTGGNSDG